METVKINTLEVNKDNPRIIRDENFKKLVKSIKDFPQMLELRPIVVNKKMVILGGNMRYRAAKEAGLTEIPILIAEGLSKEQENEFIIKDNVGFGEWDWDIIANEWDEKKLNEWGVDVPEFGNINGLEDNFFETGKTKKNEIVIILKYPKTLGEKILKAFGKESKEETIKQLLKVK